MALIYSPTATATVAANTNAITVAGMDLTPVLPGMVVNLGARDRLTGDGYIIAAVTPTGTSGGTLALVGTVPTAFTNAAFVIDTRDFNGTAPNYLIAMYTAVLTALLRLTSPLTNLLSGSRVLALDKDSAGAISRLLYAISGRTWGGLEQRTLTYTPAGGAQTSAETLALRAYPDGTTPSDAVLIDLTTGGADVQVASTTMASATTVDLGSAPTGKVAITGTVTIASFGVARHKVRDVHFVDGGAALTHNAASLILPTAATITTQAGDTLRATSDASGNWRVRSYQRADGTALALPQDAALTGAPTAPTPAPGDISGRIATTAFVAARGLSFYNRLINGNFSINQRGVAAASTTYPAGAYALDRWKAGGNGATLSWSAASSGDVTVTITAGSLQQLVEGPLYLAEGGSYILSWQGSATGRLYPLGANSAPAYAAAPVTATLTAGTTAVVELGVGTIGLVQLEPGAAASRFERRDDELRRCQRYCLRLTDQMNMGGVASSSSLIQARFAFPVDMRAPPSTSLVAGTWNVSDDYSADIQASAPTLPAATGLSARGGRVAIGGFSGLVTGRYYGGNTGVGTAALIAQAEL